MQSPCILLVVVSVVSSLIQPIYYTNIPPKTQLNIRFAAHRHQFSMSAEKLFAKLCNILKNKDCILFIIRL